MIMLFDISNIDIEGNANWHKLYNIEATFTVTHNDIVKINIPLFNIVELGDQLNRWLKKGMTSNFQYISMNSTEEEIFTITRFRKGWRIDSAWQDDEIDEFFSAETIKIECEHLIMLIKTHVKSELEIDLEPIIF